MKKITILFGLLLIFSSCSKKSDDLQEFGYEGKWELIKVISSFSGAETTGADLGWQEFYIFQKNGTVTKSRNWDGTITEISGTYVVVNKSDRKYIEITYATESEIIGSCTSGVKEMLLLNPDNTLRSIGEAACDGPQLVFDKVEY